MTIKFRLVDPLDIDTDAIAFNPSKLEKEIYLLLQDGQPRTTRYIREQLQESRNWLSKKFLSISIVSDACFSLWNKHKVIATYNYSLTCRPDQRAWIIKQKETIK